MGVVRPDLNIITLVMTRGLASSKEVKQLRGSVRRFMHWGAEIRSTVVAGGTEVNHAAAWAESCNGYGARFVFGGVPVYCHVQLLLWEWSGSVRVSQQLQLAVVRPSVPEDLIVALKAVGTADGECVATASESAVRNLDDFLAQRGTCGKGDEKQEMTRKREFK